MKFKKQLFGFMDMLRFTKLVPNRRAALAAGADTPLPETWAVNEQARALHPGRMQVELTEVIPLTPRMTELVFRRVDADAFPFFRAGQYVSLQGKVGDSVVSRPYSIASSPRRPSKTGWCWAWKTPDFSPSTSHKRQNPATAL